MSFLIAPVITQSLTNYFIASNQIVKQLRRPSDDHESLREDQMLPASKAVRATIYPPLCRQMESLKYLQVLKTSVVKGLLRGLLENCYGVRTRLPGFSQKNRLSTSLRPPVLPAPLLTYQNLLYFANPRIEFVIPGPTSSVGRGFLLD
jgi:hypothetical protein